MEEYESKIALVRNIYTLIPNHNENIDKITKTLSPRYEINSR